MPFSKAQSNTFAFIFIVLGGMAWTPAIWALGNYIGPEYEGHAVEDLHPVEAICEGGDLVAIFEVAKNHGIYRGLRFEIKTKGSVRFEVDWRDENDWPPDRVENRAPGDLLVGPLRIADACGEDYYVTTYHRSSVGWWTFVRTFGPFRGEEQ